MSTLSGRWAETIARRYALLRGATLVARNEHERGGELDLILRHWFAPGWTKGRWGQLVFAEVKGRRGGFDPAIAAVGPRKQRRLLRAAEAWLRRRGESLDTRSCRFDVFAVTLDERGRPAVRWIQNAFGRPGW
ncbi:MAG TPA: YraN family protein [Planctomycetes bacterium]|nr:YraN family protein [Planctomycetota bacterium]